MVATISETDFTFPTSSRHRAEEILAETKATYHVQLFSGVKHGFSTRGNPDDPNEREFLFAFLRSLLSDLVSKVGLKRSVREA